MGSPHALGLYVRAVHLACRALLSFCQCIRDKTMSNFPWTGLYCLTLISVVFHPRVISPVPHSCAG